MAKLISKTYADALFELAIEENKIDCLMDEAISVKRIFEVNVELSNLLNHPQVMKEEKIEVVENVFSAKISKEFLGFILIVIEKDRFKEFTSILDYFIDSVKEYKKIGVAYVTTAISLNAITQVEIMEKLVKTTKYDSMEMNFIVDEGIIGGMIIRIKDRVVDTSIATKLTNLKMDLQKIQLQVI